jgi:hypothetical protein
VTSGMPLKRTERASPAVFSGKSTLGRGVKLPRGLTPNLRWHMRVRAATFPDTPHVAQEVKELRALLWLARMAQENVYRPEGVAPGPLERALIRLEDMSKPARRVR